MKISTGPAPNLDPLHGGHPAGPLRRSIRAGAEPVAAGAPGPGLGGPAVRVDLSTQSRELAAVLAAAAAAPEVRTERLTAIRQALEAGTYRIDPVVVARAMLERGA